MGKISAGCVVSCLIKAFKQKKDGPIIMIFAYYAPLGRTKTGKVSRLEE